MARVRIASITSPASSNWPICPRSLSAGELAQVLARARQGNGERTVHTWSFAGFATTCLSAFGLAEVESDDAEAWETVERIAPTNAELRSAVPRFPPPPEWLEEKPQPY